MNMFYIPDGAGWRVTDFYWQGPDYVVTVEEGYEGETSFENYEFPDPISTIEQAEAAILSLPQFVQSTGPIHGGGFPAKKH